MSGLAFIAKGTGYVGDRTQDGFTVLAEPLAVRETRVFNRADGSPGVTYESHSLKLAVRADAHDATGTHGRRLYVLLHHGGGAEVWAIPSFYDGGAFERALLAMPEPVQYAALYTLYEIAKRARNQGSTEAAQRWGQAFIDKRLKRKRRAGRVSVEIVEYWTGRVDGQAIPGKFKTATMAMDAAQAAAPEGAKVSAFSAT